MIIGPIKMKIARWRINRQVRRSTEEKLERRILGGAMLGCIIGENDGIQIVVPVVVMLLMQFGDLNYHGCVEALHYTIGLRMVWRALNMVVTD